MNKFSKIINKELEVKYLDYIEKINFYLVKQDEILNLMFAKLNDIENNIKICYNFNAKHLNKDINIDIIFINNLIKECSEYNRLLSFYYSFLLFNKNSKKRKYKNTVSNIFKSHEDYLRSINIVHNKINRVKNLG